jgi:hypothetical protein
MPARLLSRWCLRPKPNFRSWEGLPPSQRAEEVPAALAWDLRMGRARWGARNNIKLSRITWCHRHKFKQVSADSNGLRASTIQTLQESRYLYKEVIPLRLEAVSKFNYHLEGLTTTAIRSTVALEAAHLGARTPISPTNHLSNNIKSCRAAFLCPRRYWCLNHPSKLTALNSSSD